MSSQRLILLCALAWIGVALALVALDYLADPVKRRFVPRRRLQPRGFVGRVRKRRDVKDAQVRNVLLAHYDRPSVGIRELFTSPRRRDGANEVDEPDPHREAGNDAFDAADADEPIIALPPPYDYMVDEPFEENGSEDLPPEIDVVIEELEDLPAAEEPEYDEHALDWVDVPADPFAPPEPPP